MASGIQNAQDLIAVLDAIYENTSQMDTYTGADGTTKGSLKLYYNEISKTATIFKKTTKPLDPLDPVITNVVATFNPENIVTNDKTFITKVMKNVVVSNHSAYANDVGVGAFVDVKTLIRNICAALGVNMAANFDELNPGYYDEMLAIVHKYYGDELVNNAPYGLAKKVETVEGQDVVTYHSYIPVMIIVEIAIYLNNLGVFGVSNAWLGYNKLGISNYYQSPFNAGIGFDLTKQSWFSVGEINSFFTKNEFKNLILMRKKYYNASYGSMNFDFNLFQDALDRFLNLYDAEINFDNFLVLYMTFSTYRDKYFYLFHLYELPNTVKVKNTFQSINNYWVYDTEAYTETIYHAKVVYNSDTLEYDSITNDKSVTSCVANTLRAVELIGYNNVTVDVNIKNNKYIKHYTKEILDINPLIDRYSYLPTNEFISIKKLNLIDYFGNVGISAVGDSNNQSAYMYFYQLYKYLKDNNIEITSDDYAIFTLSSTSYNSSQTGKLRIYKNIDKIKLLRNIDRLKYSTVNVAIALTEDTEDNYYNTLLTNFGTTSSYPLYTFNTVSGDIIEFESNIEEIIISFNNAFDAVTKTTNTVNKVNFPSNETIVNSNLGEMVEITSDGPIDGLTLQEGATYPSNVIDYTSWLTTYPDWQRIGYSQPFFEDDVITNTYNAQWAAITVSQDPPTEQDDGQSGRVDLDDVDDVIDDIDQAEEDSDEPPTDPNSDGDDDNTGDTPSEDSLSELPNAITSGLIKQYMLTTSEMQDFAEALIRPNTWTALNMLLSNPIDAIISLQSGYLFNTSGATSQYMTFNGYTFNDCTATKLATNYLSMDLGTINIQPYFDTYQDVLNSELEIFLPYIGYITLDISEFLGGSIHLRCRVDTLTGIILYSIYCVRDGHEQLVQQVNGNCQVQLPINSSDYHALFRALSGKVGQ